MWVDTCLPVDHESPKVDQDHADGPNCDQGGLEVKSGQDESHHENRPQGYAKRDQGVCNPKNREMRNQKTFIVKHAEMRRAKFRTIIVLL